VNDIQLAAIAMGIDPPLFPSVAHLTCVGCGKLIEGEAYDTNEGWLCAECAVPEVKP